MGDDDTRVSVSTEVDGVEAQRVWKHGSHLTVKIKVWTKQAIQRPAVDLYFHSSAGRMIFARSDHFVDSPSEATSHNWLFEFQFENNGLVSDYMTIDVGFRFSCSTRYLGLWRRLAAVALGPVPSGYTQVVTARLPCHALSNYGKWRHERIA